MADMWDRHIVTCPGCKARVVVRIVAKECETTVSASGELETHLHLKAECDHVCPGPPGDGLPLPVAA